MDNNSIRDEKKDYRGSELKLLSPGDAPRKPDIGALIKIVGLEVCENMPDHVRLVIENTSSSTLSINAVDCVDHLKNGRITDGHFYFSKGDGDYQLLKGEKASSCARSTDYVVLIDHLLIEGKPVPGTLRRGIMGFGSWRCE